MSLHTRSIAPPSDLDRALRACRGAFGLVFAYSCGYNLLLLAPSLYLLQIYDRVLSSRSLDTLVLLTLIVAVAVLVDALLDAVRRGALARIGIWLEDRLGPTVLDAALDYGERKDRGVAAEAPRDLAAIRQFIGSPGATALFDLPWALVFVGVLFLVHPLLGGLAVAGALVMCAAALLNETVTRGPQSRAQIAESGTQQRFGAVLRNVGAVRAMGMLDGVRELVAGDQFGAREAQASALRRGEALQTVSRGTRSLLQVLIMGAAAWLVLSRDLNPGIIFVASLLLGRSLAPIEGVVGSWKAIGSVRLALGRLREVLGAHPPAEDRERSSSAGTVASLSVDGVTYVPPGTTSLALQGVSLRLAAGDCVGIVGPSGSGKTMLIRLILGVVVPSMGRVRIGGVEAAAWLAAGGAKHVGYLPQETELFEGTIAQNIARLGAASAGEVETAAARVGAHEAIAELPAGYDTEVGPGGGRLSGGQRRQVALARAFFGAPRLVVLDDPTAGLDEEGHVALFRAIGEAKAAGVTVVVVTHRLAILEAADKVAVLRRGILASFGPAREALAGSLSPDPTTCADAKERQAGAAVPSAARTPPARRKRSPMPSAEAPVAAAPAPAPAPGGANGKAPAQKRRMAKSTGIERAGAETPADHAGPKRQQERTPAKRSEKRTKSRSAAAARSPIEDVAAPRSILAAE